MQDLRLSDTFTVSYRGKDYKVTANFWHPDFAMGEMVWLVKMLGESVISLIVGSGSASALLDKKIDVESFVPAVKNLMHNLNADDVTKRFKSYFSKDGIFVNDQKISYDTFFIGKIGLLVVMAAHLLYMQLADVFELLPVKEEKN